MAYFFECDNGEEYVVEANSFAEAEKRFAARFAAVGCGNNVPIIRSFRTSFNGIFSAMKLSIVA